MNIKVGDRVRVYTEGVITSIHKHQDHVMINVPGKGLARVKHPDTSHATWEILEHRPLRAGDKATMPWLYQDKTRFVTIMAIADGWALIRYWDQSVGNRKIEDLIHYEG